MVALCAEGMTEEEASRQIFTLDSQGLITTDRDLLPYKQKFAQDPAALDWLQEEQDGQLGNVVKQAGITVLIGTSGQPGCFSKEVVLSLLEHTDRPVVMPLSNPTDHAEAVPADIYSWTRGQALVGTGSPFLMSSMKGGPFPWPRPIMSLSFPGWGWAPWLLAPVLCCRSFSPQRPGRFPPACVLLLCRTVLSCHR